MCDAYSEFAWGHCWSPWSAWKPTPSFLRFYGFILFFYEDHEDQADQEVRIVNVEETFELIETQSRYVNELNLIKAPKGSIDFLQAVYSNEGLPLSVRMRAAIAALPFETPKLAVTANVQSEGIAALLEARLCFGVE